MAATRPLVLAWDLPTRLFHWLLALSFLGAYISGEAEDYDTLHLLFGYTIAILIVFRLAWGIVGTRYARFSGFAFSPRAVLAYARSLLSRSPQHFVGHNPLGSWAAIALLALVTLTVASGIAAHVEFGGEVFEEIHEVTAQLALALVLLHIAGVVVSSLLHRENLVLAMITGRKKGTPREAAEGRRMLVALTLAGVVVAFWSGTFSLPGMDGNAGLITAATQPAVDRGHAEEDD